MELLFAILVFGVILYIAVGFAPRKNWHDDHMRKDPLDGSKPRKASRPSRTVAPDPIKKPARPRADMPVIEGPARIIDGDTIVIQKTEIRIYGVDAPELNHPYGQRAKWTLIGLCKGHRVRAKIIEMDTHGRAVALCYLPDGRDLSEEMVKLGLALDWPKYSQGDYRMFEPPGVRKKLWLADARQKGRMHVWAQFDAAQKARADNQPK